MLWYQGQDTCALPAHLPGGEDRAGGRHRGAEESRDDHDGLDARRDREAWSREHRPRSSNSGQGTRGMRPEVGLWAEEAGALSHLGAGPAGGAAPPAPGPLPLLTPESRASSRPPLQSLPTAWSAAAPRDLGFKTLHPALNSEKTTPGHLKCVLQLGLP